MPDINLPPTPQNIDYDPNTGYDVESALALPDTLSGGIEILIRMAQKNEIDPKNIDIIDVTDRFLKAIAATPKENLRLSGKILFQASVLLRMKAEALLATKMEDFDFGDDFLEFDAEGSPIIYDSQKQPIARQITLQDLEKALVRRTKSRQLRQRQVTLAQLIEALREAERIEQSRVFRKPKATIDLEGYAEMHDMGDILDLAHDENIEDIITLVEEVLVKFLQSQDTVSLSQLLTKLGKHSDWVDTFLAVLFLSNAGKIGLEQEEFYKELYFTKSAN